MTKKAPRGHQRTHLLTVRVTFDCPCTKAEAAAAFRDCVYGPFYPFVARPTGAPVGPEMFSISSVKSRRNNL